MNKINSIKKIIFVVTILFCFTFTHTVFSNAADVTVTWDANTETDLGGYYIYYKKGSSGAPYNGTGIREGNSPIKVKLEDLNDPENPKYTLHDVSDTESTYMVGTAYDNDNNESGYSNEIFYKASSVITNICLSDATDDNFDWCVYRKATDQGFTVYWDIDIDAIKYELKLIHYFYNGLGTDIVETSDNYYTFISLPRSSRHFDVKIRAIYDGGGVSNWGFSSINGSPKNWLIYSKPPAPVW